MVAVAATSNTPSTDTAIIIHDDKDEDEFPLHLFLSSGGIECGSAESKEAIKKKNAEKTDALKESTINLINYSF